MSSLERSEVLPAREEAHRGARLTAAYRKARHWWTTWQTRSGSRRLVGAMLTVGALTACVRVLVGVKDLVVADHFGTTAILDAYLIALVLPQFAVTLIAGSFNVALMPTYIQVREQDGPVAAQTLLSAVMAWATLLLTVVTVLMAIGAPAVMAVFADKFRPEHVVLATRLYYVMLPLLVLSGLSTIWAALLNAHGRFGLAAIVPVITPVATILSLFGLADQWHVYVLSGALVLGAFVESAWLGWALTREGLSLVPRWQPRLPASARVWEQFTPVVVAALLMGGTTVVTQYMAAHLGPSHVSAYAYGTKVTHLIAGVGAVAVGTAVLPHFSRMVAVEDWLGLRRTFLRGLLLMAALTVPVTLVLVVWAKPIITLLFERGAFTAADSEMVSQVHTMFVLQGPPYIMSLLAVRLLSALKANRFMLWGNLINLTACIGFNMLFTNAFGVAGIALATSAMYLVSFLCAAVAAWYLLNQRLLPIAHPSANGLRESAV